VRGGGLFQNATAWLVVMNLERLGYAGIEKMLRVVAKIFLDVLKREQRAALYCDIGASLNKLGGLNKLNRRMCGI
jgi:hypothetical protein